MVVGCDGTVVGNPGCDWMEEVVTCASCSVCTGGEEKVARGSGVSCGGVDGSNVGVDERTSAEAAMGRSKGSNQGSKHTQHINKKVLGFSSHLSKLHQQETSKKKNLQTCSLLRLK